MDSGDKMDLQTLTGWYEQSEQSSIESRFLSERDRDYYDHKQWSEEEMEVLERRGQPAITVNRIKPKVDFLQGLERQNRTDPKAFPRTPKHEKAADAATDAIRYVLDNNEFDYTSSDVFFSELVEGTGGVEVLVSRGPDGWWIDIERYEWDRLFWDAHSLRKDFRDAKFKGTVIWQDFEDAEAMAKEAGLSDDEAEALLVTDPSYGDTYEDAPRTHWVDSERKRVKIVSMWYQQNGVWYWCKFTKNGYIKKPRVSPFLDEDGMPECGLEMQSAFVDRDGNRYGWVRTQIDMQDEINKRRSKALHLLSVRQFKFTKGAVDDVQRTKTELAKPDGAIEVNPNSEFELLLNNDLAQGQALLLQEATAEIDRVAATPQGDDKVRSGRAEIARQQASTMELGPIFDGHRSWKKRVYRQVWNRIRQFWGEERWIRVTDNEDNLKWVGLNRPITGREKLNEQLQQMSPDQLRQPEMQMILQQMANDPRLDQPVDMENQVAELDVDIILDEAPDYMTIQQEQFDQLVQLYNANPQGIPWEAIFRASQLRNKEAILDMLKGDPKQAQARQEQARIAFETEVQGRQAEIDKDRAQARKYLADAIKTQKEAGI